MFKDKKAWFSVLFTLLIFSGCLTTPDSRFKDVSGWDSLSASILDDKKDFKPELTDVSYLLAMQNSDNPRHRRAAVILMDQLGETGLQPLIMKSLNDPDEDVRAEVFRIAMRKEPAYTALAGRALAGRDTELILGALHFLRLRTKPDYKNEIARMFSHDNEDVRKRAALVFFSLFPVSDPWITEALKDPDPLVRETALVVLGLSADPIYIPQIIKGLYDDERIVQDKAQFTILIFGKQAIPQLFKALKDGSPNVQLMVLQVFEGMQEVETLSGIIPLVFSSDQRISIRSRMVISSFKKEATPYLVGAIKKETDPVRISELLTILEEIKDPASIDFFAGYLNHKEPEVRTIATLALISFGETALPVLRERMNTGTPEEQPYIIRTLLLMNDPFLIIDPLTGKIDHNRAVSVIVLTDKEALKNYLNSTSLNIYKIEDLLQLKDLTVLIGQWLSLSSMGDANPVFSYYLQWEQNLLQADRLNKESRMLNREFLETQDPETLRESRKKREEAQILASQADDYSFLATSLKASDQKKGKKLINEYQRIREEILTINRTLGPDLRPMCFVLLENHGLTLQSLIDGDWIRGQKPF